MKNKHHMHAPLNFASVPVLFGLLPLALVFLLSLLFRAGFVKEVVIGVSVTAAFVTAICAFGIWLAAYVERCCDSLVFENDRVLRVSPFRKKQDTFRYEDYLFTVGEYRMGFTTRPCVILTPISCGRPCVSIDTDAFWRCIRANRMNILYCVYDQALVQFLSYKYQTLAYQQQQQQQNQQ